MAESTAGPRLRPPLHRVSRRSIPYWTIRAIPGWVFLLLFVTIWVTVDADLGPAWLALPVVLLVLAAAHVIVMPQWRYRVHRWEYTREAVYTQAGWLNQERRIAPVSRIQTVDTHRGPLEQLFGLANVTVTTASAAGPLRINGLDLGVAEQLADHLTRQTQQTPGDAT